MENVRGEVFAKNALVLCDRDCSGGSQTALGQSIANVRSQWVIGFYDEMLQEDHRSVHPTE